MPQNGFDGPITLGAGANRFVTLLVAAGYTGHFGLSHVTIKNRSGASIYIARDSQVSDSGGHKGREIEDGESYTWPALARGSHDFYQQYIYSAAGGPIDVDLSTK